MAAAGRSCNQGITATREQASASFSVKNTEGKSERDSQYPRGGKELLRTQPPFLPANAQPFVSPRRGGAPKLELETWLRLPYTGEPLPFSTGSGSGAREARRFPRAAGAGLLTPGVTLSRNAPAVFLPHLGPSSAAAAESFPQPSRQAAPGERIARALWGEAPSQTGGPRGSRGNDRNRGSRGLFSLPLFGWGGRKAAF